MFITFHVHKIYEMETSVATTAILKLTRNPSTDKGNIAVIKILYPARKF